MIDNAPIASAEDKCKCEVKDLRYRVGDDKVRRVFWQCVLCGSLKQAPKSAENIGGDTPPVDVELSNRYWKSRSSVYEEKQAAKKAEWWEKYHAYILSPEWGVKRAAVMARDKGICQGCLEKPAAQVHHLSYANLGNELLFELVALCKDCHTRAHGREF